MKKLLSLVVAAVLCMSLFAACGESSSSSSTAAKSEAKTETKSEAAPAATEEKSEAASESHEAITIKLQGAFAEGADHYWYFEQFCQSVNEYSDGSLTVVWGAGPEAIPTDQLGEAMQNQIVELVYTPTAYLDSMSKAMGAMKLLDAYECRTNGGYEYLDGICEDVFKCHFLGRCAMGSKFCLTTQFEVNSLEDFKGQVFRGTAAHRPLLEALGAEVVTMGWADVYSAIDKNVVAGVGGTYRDFVDNDLGGKCKYLIQPGFYDSDSSLFITDTAWAKLDDLQKEALEKAAIDWENAAQAYNDENNEIDIKKLEDAGTVVIDLEELGCADEFLDTAYNAVWDSIAADNAQMAEDLRKFASR